MADSDCQYDLEIFLKFNEPPWVSYCENDILQKQKLQQSTFEEVLQYFRTVKEPTIFCILLFKLDLVSWLRRLKDYKTKSNSLLKASISFNQSQSHYILQIQFSLTDSKGFKQSFVTSLFETSKPVYLESKNQQIIDEKAIICLWNEDTRFEEYHLSTFLNSMKLFIKESHKVVPLPRRIYVEDNENVTILNWGHYYIEKDENFFIVYKQGNELIRFQEDQAAVGIAKLLTQNE